VDQKLPYDDRYTICMLQDLTGVGNATANMLYCVLLQLGHENDPVLSTFHLADNAEDRKLIFLEAESIWVNDSTPDALRMIWLAPPKAGEQHGSFFSGGIQYRGNPNDMSKVIDTLPYYQHSSTAANYNLWESI
jgi:hypothetical protein